MTVETLQHSPRLFRAPQARSSQAFRLWSHLPSKDISVIVSLPAFAENRGLMYCEIFCNLALKTSILCKLRPGHLQMEGRLWSFRPFLRLPIPCRSLQGDCVPVGFSSPLQKSRAWEERVHPSEALFLFYRQRFFAKSCQTYRNAILKCFANKKVSSRGHVQLLRVAFLVPEDSSG
uniref:Uncharacterized protein n=1 Tax=Micrurus surinamensis TaxID=129470 RepID=A0A2D4P4U0_MICSU